jgi:aryl-alcohol dehydrogenase-like predicted oxidoreductase
MPSTRWCAAARSAEHIVRIDSVQPRYNLLFRQFELDLLPLCLEEGIGVIPYNPLAGGLLSGKHRPGPPADGTRFTLGNAAQIYQQRYWHDREFTTVEALRAVADEAAVPLTTLAVAWVLANPAITSPIIGASRPEQLADSVEAVGLTLDADLLSRLDEITAEYRRGDAER